MSILSDEVLMQQLRLIFFENYHREPTSVELQTMFNHIKEKESETRYGDKQGRNSPNGSA